MRYADAVDAFFRSPPAGTPAPTTEADRTPARALRDAIEPIAMVSVWGAEAHAAYEELGLDFLSGYVFGRAAPLGVVPTEVVVATFGVFAPAVVGPAYEAGTAACSPAAVLTAREEGTVAAFARVLGPPGPEVDEVVRALRDGLAAADVMGRPLFAGLRAMNWPADGWGRLWHAACLLREYRGDAHLAACVAAGLGPVAANLLTEAHVGLLVDGRPDRSYTASRGWTPAEVDDAVARLGDRGLVDADGRVAPRGRGLRTEVEVATEAALDPVLEGIGDALDTVVARGAAWSVALTDGGAFPPDPFKRAAG